MRDPQAQLPSVHSNRFEPTLGHCLMDSDPEVQRLTRANRRRSMLLSTLIQTSLLTAAIVLPLFASQTIPGFRNEPRLLPQRGMPIVDVSEHRDASQPPPSKQPTKRTPKWSEFVPPRTVPTTIEKIDDRAEGGPPNVGIRGDGCPSCRLDGIPGLDPRVFNDFNVAPPPKAPVSESQPRGPISVSPGVQEARLIHRVEPVYPILAKQTKREGTVKLRAIIAKDGSVRDLEVVSGHPLLIQAAVDAVQQWRYTPTMLGVEPVEVQTHITVIFILSR